MSINIPFLYSELDRIRTAKNQSWYGVAKDLEISQSTFTKMKAGKTIGLETFAKLVKWLGAKPEKFFQ